MKVKRDTYNLFLAWFFCFYLGILYQMLVAGPFLRLDTDRVAFLGDSYTYLDFAMNTSIKSFLFDITNYKPGLFSLFGIVGIGKLALAISYNNANFIIFFINIFLLFLILRNCLLIYRKLENNHINYKNFLWLFLLNPAVFVNLSSLNKEILGIFFISSFLKNSVYRSYYKFFFVICISFFFKDVFFYIGILFGLMQITKFNRLIYLIAISIIISLSPIYSVESFNTSEILGQQSAEFFNIFTKIELYPLGYSLTYIPKLIISLFSAMRPQRLMELSFIDLYGSSITLSSIFFFLCSVILCYKALLSKKFPIPTFVNMLLAYTFIGCIVPYSQHRLFLPLYIIFPLMIFCNTYKRMNQV